MDNISDFAKLFSDKLGSNPEKVEAIFNMFKQSSSEPKSSNDCDSNSQKKHLSAVAAGLPSAQDGRLPARSCAFCSFPA